jgi:3-deoxy-D-manno-octulosonic-acid transferase
MTAPPPAKPRPLSLKAYRVAAGLASPLARPVLEARARRGKEDPARLSERLGRASVARPDGPLVWLHAASVGESVSLLPLMAAITVERPDIILLITSGTRASAEILAKRLPPGAIHQYAPVDTPAAVRRFLSHWRPGLGIFVESELWPNLILTARADGARLALVSARMTERSARAWRGRRKAVGAMLRAFDVILPQDSATEARLIALGGAISGRLNLKRVGGPLDVDAAELARLQAMIGERPVVVAVSTHPGEEVLIADAVSALPGKPLLVIAPRHPARAAEIVRDLAPRRVVLRSSGEAITPDTDVYLADTLNELGLSLRLAPVAIVGGGWASGVGGHNPLEPARLGVGVISGPHVANWADIYAEMAANDGAVFADDGGVLALLLAELMDDPPRVRGLAAAASAYAARGGDELGAAMSLLRPLLPAP